MTPPVQVFQIRRASDDQWVDVEIEVPAVWALRLEPVTTPAEPYRPRPCDTEAMRRSRRLFGVPADPRPPRPITGGPRRVDPTDYGNRGGGVAMLRHLVDTIVERDEVLSFCGTAEPDDDYTSGELIELAYRSGRSCEASR